MPDRSETLPRHILPIPGVIPISHTTFDAKDPDTKFPQIEPLRPPMTWILEPRRHLADPAGRRPSNGWRPMDSGTTAFIRRRSARQPEPRC